MDSTEFLNIGAMLKRTVEMDPHGRAFSWFKASGEKESVAWNEFYHQAEDVAKGLMALGAKKGTTLSIISHSGYRWALIDMAAALLGLPVAGIFPEFSADDCRSILRQNKSGFLIVEREKQLQELCGGGKKLPGVKNVILMEGNPGGDDYILSWNELLGGGRNVSAADLQKQEDSVKPNDSAALIYSPDNLSYEGALFTHGAVISGARALSGILGEKGSGEQFHFLPLPYVTARAFLYHAIYHGHHITFGSSMEHAPGEIALARPHYFLTNSMFLQRIYRKVVADAERRGRIQLSLFNLSLQTGYRMSNCLEAGCLPSKSLEMMYRGASLLVFNRIRRIFGGRLKFCFCGDGRLDPAIAKFFHSAGILILEGLSMTENFAFSHCNLRENFRFGWAGTPLPGIRHKLGDHNMLMIAGKSLCKKIQDDEGWLETGYSGEIDDEDFLRVTGRGGDLISTSSGKKIAAPAIETLMATSVYIDYFLVCGRHRNFLTGLVVLNRESISDYAAREKISYFSFEELRNNNKIKELIEREVEEKNRYLASFETVKKVLIVAEFTREEYLLTPLDTVNRERVEETCREKIELLYKNAEDENISTAYKPMVERRLMPERRVYGVKLKTVPSYERRREQRRESVRW